LPPVVDHPKDAADATRMARDEGGQLMVTKTAESTVMSCSDNNANSLLSVADDDHNSSPCGARLPRMFPVDHQAAVMPTAHPPVFGRSSLSSAAAAVVVVSVDATSPSTGEGGNTSLNHNDGAVAVAAMVGTHSPQDGTQGDAEKAALGGGPQSPRRLQRRVSDEEVVDDDDRVQTPLRHNIASGGAIGISMHGVNTTTTVVSVGGHTSSSSSFMYSGDWLPVPLVITAKYKDQLARPRADSIGFGTSTTITTTSSSTSAVSWVRLGGIPKETKHQTTQHKQKEDKIRRLRMKQLMEKKAGKRVQATLLLSTQAALHSVFSSFGG
jgi:hypothetical protein